jgi:putative hemolysin
MLQQAEQPATPRKRRLHVGLAHGESEIREAQKLRYRIFAEELGARLPTRTPGIDIDLYDPFCDHLIVRDEDNNRIVGTYRILTPHAARRVGGYYSETEFDLTRLQLLRESMVEIGRSCIDPDYRTGGTIALLWSGLARYMAQGNYRTLIGCASIGMADGGHIAANLYSRLKASTWRRRSTASSRATRCRSSISSTTSRPNCRRSSRATCAPAPTSAASRPGTPTSTRPTC